MINESVNSNSFLKVNFENEPIKTTKKNEIKFTTPNVLTPNESNELFDNSSYQGRITKDLSVSDVNPSSIKFRTEDINKILVLLQDAYNKLPEDLKSKLNFNLDSFTRNIQRVMDKSGNSDNSKILDFVKGVTQTIKNVSNVSNTQNKIDFLVSGFGNSKAEELEKKLNSINISSQDKEKVLAVVNKMKNSSKSDSINYICVTAEFINKLISKAENNESIKEFINKIDNSSKTNGTVENIENKVEAEISEEEDSQPRIRPLGVISSIEKISITRASIVPEIKGPTTRPLGVTSPIIPETENDYDTKFDNVIVAAVNFKQEIDKLSLEQTNSFTDTLKSLTNKFDDIILTKDVKKIAMYSALMEKVLTKIKEGKTENQEKATGKTLGQDIVDLISEHDNLRVEFFKDSLNSSQKENILKILESYIGKDRYDLVVSSSDAKNKSVPVSEKSINNAVGKVKGVSNAELGLNSFIDSNKKLFSIDVNKFSDLNIHSKIKNFIVEIELAKDIDVKTKTQITEQIENILDNSSDELISVENINKLKNIISGIKSKDINSKETTKIIQILNKASEIKNNTDNVVEKYNTEAQNIRNTATQLDEEIKKLRPEQRNAFTDTISSLTNKLNEAIQSGDVKKIAMYSALMEKVLAKIREGKTEEQEKLTGKTLGQDIADLITEYDDLVADLFKEGLDSKQKEEILKRLEVYLGKERFNLIINSSIPNDEQNRTSSGGVSTKPSPDDIFNSMRNSLGNKTPDGKISKPTPLISNEMKEGLSKISSKNITKLFKDNPNLKKAFDNFEEATKRFLKIQAEFSKIADKLNDIIMKPIKKEDFIQNNLKEAIKELLEKIEIMEQNIDLEIHTNKDDTTIVTLLQKFREIINKLDVQTRDNINKANETLMISLKNNLHIRDMKLRWESLDKIRFELNNLLQKL